VFLAIGLTICTLIMLNRRDLIHQYGSLDGPVQIALAAALILVVLEMARRAIKIVLPAVAALVLAYAFLGQHIPGRFGHGGMPVDYLLGTLTITEGGLWGTLTGTSVDTIAMFVILGGFISAGQAVPGSWPLPPRSPAEPARVLQRWRSCPRPSMAQSPVWRRLIPQRLA
jgi:TRAP-type uncharacterized transport system fused permease subunit